MQKLLPKNLPEVNFLLRKAKKSLSFNKKSILLIFSIALLTGSPAGLNAQVQWLGQGVNSASDEIAPVISADGQTLYFARRGHEQNMGEAALEDIWVSRLLPNGQWSKAVNAGPTLNDRTANLPVSLNANMNILYFTSGNQPTLYRANSAGRGWGFPEAFTGPAFPSEGRVHSIGLSQDQRTLFFAWSPDEGRNPDLYLSFLQDDNLWSPAERLPFNSPGKEFFPYFARDGRTLYFASDGFPGEGGTDLFLVRRLDESWKTWTEPENLGPQINTPQDDRFISLTARGDQAFLVLKSEADELNIGILPLPKEMQPSPVAVYLGELKADSGMIPSGLTLTIANLNSSRDRLGRKVFISQAGSFRITVPRDETRGLFAAAPGYLPASINLENTETEVIPPGVSATATFSAAYRERDKMISLLQEKLSETESQEQQHRRLANANLNTIREKPVEMGNLVSGPAVDSLFRSFQFMFLGNRIMAAQDTVPPPADTLKKSVDDRELESLRRQYQAYYQPKAGQKDTDESSFLWDGTRQFEEIQLATRQELLEVLRPAVIQSLHEEYWPQIRLEAEQGLDPVALTRLKENESQLKERLRQDLIALYPWGPKIGKEPEGEPWEKELYKKLRISMRPQVVETLKETLGEDIRTAMKARTQQVLKELESEATCKEMDRLVLEQIKEEERQSDPWGAERESSISIKSGLPAIPKEYEEIRTQIRLKPIEVGQTVILNNVAFHPNTAQIKPSSNNELERIQLFLSENPRLVVEIGAHTNGYPSHAAAIQLSAQRAKAVADYLIAKGLEKNRIRYRGYGKTRPLATNDTLEGRRMNQRIELKIISIE